MIPVPIEGSTRTSSIMIGIRLLLIGWTAIFPCRWVYRWSDEWIAMATSPSIVSGRVVETSIYYGMVWHGMVWYGRMQIISNGHLNAEHLHVLGITLLEATNLNWWRWRGRCCCWFPFVYRVFKCIYDPSFYRQRVRWNLHQAGRIECSKIDLKPAW